LDSSDVNADLKKDRAAILVVLAARCDGQKGDPGPSARRTRNSTDTGWKAQRAGG
jgi:hypothetical protein